jgi:endoglucanase
MRSRSRASWRPSDDAFLAVLALILGLGSMVLTYRLGLTKTLIDENSHLNFARLLGDSITPGLSQIGFWPPLLHLLLAPFVLFRPLYESGLAGAVVLLPFLFLAAAFLRRIIVSLTDDRPAGFLAGTLLLLNPFMLYYAVVPMMEVLFIANVCATAYFLSLWLSKRDLPSLAWTGVFVTLACLSRYEGLILIPTVSALIFVRLLRDRLSFSEMEATLLLFGMIALVGVVFIVSYSWLYGGTPFAFAGGSWLRDPATNLRPAVHRGLLSLQFLLSSSVYMLGWPLVLTAFVSVAALPLLEKRYASYAALIVLLSPAIFVWVSQYTGSILINVPELPPYGFFNNERYGLTWIGFAILAPVLLIALLRRSRGNAAVRAAARLTAGGIGAILVATTLAYGTSTFFLNQFSIIRSDINSPSADQLHVADFLSSQYDGGKILMARVDNDPILADTGLPLSDYLYEGNYRYFDQALKEPWNFARWVVMHNAANNADPWAALNEPVFRQWGISKDFLRFYRLVYENGKRRVYKLDDGALQSVALAARFNVAAIPSLHPSSRLWDPETIYEQMHMPEQTAPASVLLSKDDVRKELLAFYERRLQPLYARGWYVDEQGAGTSESQAYALWQAFAANDPSTFDRVWQWTKTHLEGNDHLFTWRFAVSGSGTLAIVDPNSATDADTDIAYALLQAGRQWSNQDYIRDAVPIIQAIWDKETAVTADGARHVVAGNWAASPASLVLNPSYFSPHAYTLFRNYDPSHDWNGLIDQGFADIDSLSARSVGQVSSAFLPPNWATMDRRTGMIGPFAGKPDSLDYSYDAFRTFFRIALYDVLTKDPRADAFLARSTTFESDWQRSKRDCSVYFAQSGSGCQLSLGPLAAPLAVWTVTNPHFADQLLTAQYFKQGRVDVPDSTAFYERSWYWFGLWLWSHS